jgi:hypothetical protein
MQVLKNSHDEEGLPPSLPKPLASWYAQGLSDGLGDRLLMFDNSDAPSLELLRFRPELAQVPGFETALRDQVHRLDRFRHPAFARVRSVQRLEPDDDLALISNCTPGKRLSEVLHHARGPAFAAALIRQLAPALVLFQQHDAGVSHGILSPDRIVVSPDGRLTIVEHVVGPAIDTLNLRTDQLASIGIALPPGSGHASPRLDVATDWYQLGLAAVSVLIGRPVTASELPQLETLLHGLGLSAGPDGTVLSPFIRQWLERALQISGTRIESGADAHAALDEFLHKEQAGDSRWVESVRHEQAAPPAPALTSRTDRPADLIRDVAAAPLAIVPPTRRTIGDDEPRPRPIPFSPVDPAPVSPPTTQPSAPEVRAARQAPQRPPQVRVLAHQGLSLFEQEILAGKKPRPAATRPRLDDPPAAAQPRPRAEGRSRISTSLVAALALIAVVEAGVIAALARALWVAPDQAIVVETAAAGENVLVSSRSTEATPLRLTTAPDLRWVRVSSQSPIGILAGNVANTQAGTIRIWSPIKLKVFERSRQLGSVPGTDLKLPAGGHDIELVNLALGYRLKQSVEVEAGQTVSIHVAPPHGWVTVYAVPTAEVSIDGQAVGSTPLGPLPLALGEHQVTFRHPSGLKDRKRIMVRSGETVRVIGNVRR